MSHARLNHPTRPTLEFRQGQQDELQRETVANITQELGTDRPPLVHTETIDSRRTIRGTVSAFKQARDTGASDSIQALADYVDRLEAHVNEYQGDPGYTLVDDQRDIQHTATLESVQWSLTPGKKYEVDYTANVIVGRGTFESGSISRRNPTVNDSMDVMLRVDGVDLPGMRDYEMTREIGVNVNPVFNRSGAENNDIVAEEGPVQKVRFEGVHSGTLAERQAVDATLSNLQATENNVALETAFPGYTLEGFVTAYPSTLEQQRGGNSSRYTFEFTVGTRA